MTGGIFRIRQIRSASVKILQYIKSLIFRFCLPLELNYAEQRQLVNGILPAEKFLYGRIPMMVTANCVTKTTDHCRREEGFGITELTDRYHKVFPVMRNCTHCYNIIYNSVPFSLHKTAAKWKDSFCCRLEFTTESENETFNVLEYFYGSRTDLPYTEYTTGHEKRGVE
jgi:U32 family peptidase